jgi:ribonuclease HI
MLVVVVYKKKHTHKYTQVSTANLTLRNMPLEPLLPGWKAPMESKIKINFDAAMNKHTSLVGLGMVARVSGGNVLGAKRLSIFLSIDAYTAEQLAASYAVIFYLEVGFFDIIVEGDALQVIKDINSSPHFLSRNGHLIEGIKQEMQQFRSCSLVHVPRTCNEATHCLAKSVVECYCDDIWLEETPPCIVDVVVKDLWVLRS